MIMIVPFRLSVRSGRGRLSKTSPVILSSSLAGNENRILGMTELEKYRCNTLSVLRVYNNSESL
jgi:hypothetical protein